MSKLKIIAFIIIPFILLVFSCSGKEEKIIENPSSDIYFPGKEIDAFKGVYLLAALNENDEVVLEENCWTKGLDVFELNAYGDGASGYYFVFDGHHAYWYQVVNTELRGDTLILDVEAEEGYEENGNLQYKMFKIKNDAWRLEDTLGNYHILVKKEDKEQFKYIHCSEEAELTEEYLQDLIISALFKLEVPNESLDSIIPFGGILMESPGPGVAPIEDTLYTVHDVANTKIFDSPTYDYFMELIQLHINEEHTFIALTETLPDRCQPTAAGVFIKINELNHDAKTASITVLLIGETMDQEFYTYAKISFVFNDVLMIKSIDVLDCSA